MTAETPLSAIAAIDRRCRPARLPPAGGTTGGTTGGAAAFDAWLDQPPHDRLRQPWPLAQAALERHRFRAAASGPPPSHGGRAVRPALVDHRRPDGIRAKAPGPLLQIVSDAVAGGGVVADAVVWGSALLLLVVVCAVAFVAPALRTIRLDVPRARALQVD